jgi:FMN phosphatase YigB (HAD superfamily)
MALTLEEYAEWLDPRPDLYWPSPPEVQAPKTKPYLKRLQDVQVVTFNCYGTLLAIREGKLLFLHPNEFVMETALEKTIQEFKMWPAMSRKPGKPSAQLLQWYRQILDELSLHTGAERYPEVRVDDVWERIVKRLVKNEYKFDTQFYGSLNRFAECVAYFFHASLQGTGPQPGALETLRGLKERGYLLGVVGDGQCFTRVQLLRALRSQGPLERLDELFDPELIVLSFEVGARRPSEQLFRQALNRLASRGVRPEEVLHVGNDLALDILPAKRLRMRTALYAGDRRSLGATKEQLLDRASRPDLLLAQLSNLLLCLQPRSGPVRQV